MQAPVTGIPVLTFILSIFLDFRIICVFCFLKLLQSLPYAFHQLGYFTTAKKQYNHQYYEDDFKWPDFSHGSVYLFMQIYKFFLNGLLSLIILTS
jgi:hypothetical protein